MSDAKFCLRCGAALIANEAEGRSRPKCPACGWTHYGNPTPVVGAIVEHAESDSDAPCVVLVRNHGWPPKWESFRRCVDHTRICDICQRRLAA